MLNLKNSILSKLLVVISLLSFFLVFDEGMNPKELHEFFVNNSPFKETQKLTRSERKASGLPPNQYHEQLYDLTLNPTTGVPDYSSKLEAQQQIERDKDEAAKYAVPGESVATPWYEVGPKNHSGRTRAAVWDQTDGTGRRVIAGGVSGGLWKNNDITNSTSEWTRINGVPGNLAVSVIVQDEDNPSLLYVGTGENYTNGDAFGNGIYKSTDGGDNWTLVFGRGASTTVTNTGSIGNLRVEGFFSVNDIALYDHDKNPGTEPQVFAGLSSVYYYRRSSGFLTWTDENVVGLYKYDGTSWDRITSVNNGVGRFENINDIEVQEVSNRIWLSTQRSALGSSFGLGGRFWYSDDGITFTKANPGFPAFPLSGVNDRRRTEIASSHQNTDTHYIVVQTSGTASGTIPVIYKTTDNFTTFSYIEPPLDKDTGIPDEDYTRGQSGYDLEIEVDPFNDQILYVGGIDWFRSQNAGSDWSQITKWSNNNLLSTLDCSVVHADQHGLYFKPGPGNSNEAIVVNDGGVYYSSSLSTAPATNTFTEMEKNMITTQFYAVAQSPTDFAGADWIIGGTQDNGTYSVINSNQNKTDGTEIQTGDGGDTFFDQVGGHYYISSYVRNNSILRGNFDALGNIDINLGWGAFEAMNNGIDNLSSDLGIPNDEGSFINPAALDSNQDVYFSNAGNSSGANSIRVITGLERGGTPATFLIPSVSTGADFVTALEVSPFTTDRTTLFVGLKSGEVKKITNAQNLGLHVITSVYSQLGSVSDIQFGDNENEIYLTYYNYGLNAANNSNIRYTNNGFAGGVSSNKEGDLPDIPVLTILNNPFEDDEVIVGTDLGVWRTANFSAANPNWTSAYEGMQDVAVRDLDYRGVSALDNRVLAASYGRGVFVGSFTSNSNPPITVADSVTVAEGGTVTTTTGGATSVLSNDSDPDGDPITTDLVSTTLNGTLTLSPSGTGSFTYTHNDTETTTDTFWYRAYDGAVHGNTVSVTINITPVNECPIVQNPLSNVTVPEDASDTVIPITNIFNDPESNILTYTVTNTNAALVTVSLDTTTLTLNYASDATGTATITIFANDSGCGSLVPHEFLVTVNSDNDLPIGVSDTVTVTEGGTVTVTTAGATSVLFNDTDLENHTLTVGIGKGAIAPSVSKGSINLLNDGSFTYTHNGNQNPGDIFTTDSFLYRPFDLGAGPDAGFGNTTTVTIQILHTNDCPIINIPINDFNAMEDDPDLEIDISSVFSDEENDAITLTVSSTNLALLSATKSSATTLTIDYVDNMTGSSTIILYATDNTAECSTLVSSTFVISVEPENDTPVGVPDTITVFEGSSVTTTTAGNSVLVNDTDTEGDNLTVIKLTDPLWHQEGGANFTLQASGTFIYNHDSSETTTDSFTYRLTDSFTTTDVLVTINIIPVNDCPEVAVPPLPDVNVPEDSVDTVINLNDYFTDAENDPLSYSFTNDDTSLVTVTLLAENLTIDYIPEQNGTTTITIFVDDSQGCNTTQDVFIVNVADVNDVPVSTVNSLIVDEGGTVTTTTNGFSSLLDNDIDAEGETLTAIEVTSPVNGSLTLLSSGTFQYVHNGSETTTDSFQYKANDGIDDGNTVTVSITINPVNDCPVWNDSSFATQINTVTRAEDFTNFNWPTPLQNYVTDPDNPSHTITVSYTNSDIVSISIGGLGRLFYSSIPNQHGSSTGTITIDDGTCKLYQPISITISPINDCPTLDNPVDDVSVTEDEPDRYVPLADIFSDVDVADVLTYTATPGDSSLIATSITSTALIIDFLLNQNGSTFVSLMVSDGDDNCTVDDLFNVTVVQENDQPTGVEDLISVVNGGTISVLNDGATNSVLSNDSDPESDPITAVLASPPNNGTLTFLNNGNFTYTHDGSATTTDSFTYTPRDFGGIGNTTTVTIYINNLPVGFADTIQVIEGGTTTVTTNASTSVLSNDTDTDAGDTSNLTASIETSPAFGTLVLNSDGSFIYTHDDSENLSDSFTYLPYDQKGYGLPTTVSISVTNTNGPPVAFTDSIILGLGSTSSLLANGTNNVLLNDIDPDGDVLTATLVSTPSFGTIVLNPGGTFTYVQDGVMNGGDSFTYKANDGVSDSNVVSVTIALTCSPCTESTIEGGSNGVVFTYKGCDCRDYDVYVPKGKTFIFCHLNNSISISQGSYTVITTKVCK